MDKDLIKKGTKTLIDIRRMLKRWARFARKYDDPEHFMEMLEMHRVDLVLRNMCVKGLITEAQVAGVGRLCSRLMETLYLPEPKVQLYGYLEEV